MKKYDYIIVGCGIAGCSIGYFLSKYNKNILLIDRNEDLSKSASSAAGGFLSPLLGKPNSFKDLVSTALKYSIDFYKQHFPDELINKGVLRIPKNNEDEIKFKEYIKHIDFEHILKDNGLFFPVGSQVLTQTLCEKMSQNIDKIFNEYITSVVYENETYILNDKFIAKKLILTTGANLNLINEEYFNIRAVFGQRIIAKTSTKIDMNYHKNCSVSTTKNKEDDKNIINIGATHHRFEKNSQIFKEYLKNQNISILQSKEEIKNDTNLLLSYANDIVKLDDLEVIDIKFGARASSVDYFPIVGELVNSIESIKLFPYMQKGTNVADFRLACYKNIYVLNGLGGRGFVLAPYLADILSKNLENGNQIPQEINSHRLYKKWIKRKFC